MRKTRSDCTVGAFEKKHGLPAGTIRNENGRDTRSDKKGKGEKIMCDCFHSLAFFN